MTVLYFVSLGVSLTTEHTIQLHPLWLAVTAIFVTERVVTVRSRGPFQMALAGILLVEMTFDVFLQAVHGKAIWDAAFGTERRW